MDVKVGIVFGWATLFLKTQFQFLLVFLFFFLGTIASLSKFTDHPLLQYTRKSNLIHDNRFPDIYVNCDGIVDA